METELRPDGLPSGYWPQCGLRTPRSLRQRVPLRERSLPTRLLDRQGEDPPVAARHDEFGHRGDRRKIDVNPLSDQNPPRKTNSGEASNDTSPLECEIKNSATWD